jgi:hypothetical protein
MISPCACMLLSVVRLMAISKKMILFIGLFCKLLKLFKNNTIAAGYLKKLYFGFCIRPILEGK